MGEDCGLRIADRADRSTPLLFPQSAIRHARSETDPQSQPRNPQ
jgi:hypothetical protein